MNVAYQVGTQDCGLFAVAYMTFLAYGDNPTDMTYKQESMRHHLITCFETKKLTIFPSKRRKVTKKLNYIVPVGYKTLVT